LLTVTNFHLVYKCMKMHQNVAFPTIKFQIFWGGAHPHSRLKPLPTFHPSMPSASRCPSTVFWCLCMQLAGDAGGVKYHCLQCKRDFARSGQISEFHIFAPLNAARVECRPRHMLPSRPDCHGNVTSVVSYSAERAAIK